MPQDPGPQWDWPPWWPARSNQTSKVQLPEAGGWMYQFRDQAGLFSHVFVPDLNTWANAIAYAISPPKNAPVAVALDFGAVTRVKQAVPHRRP